MSNSSIKHLCIHSMFEKKENVKGLKNFLHDDRGLKSSFEGSSSSWDSAAREEHIA